MTKALCLPGRAVLITGAAGGIGAATAELLYERGARLALVDRDADRLEELAQRLDRKRVLVSPADVTVTAQMEDAVARAAAAFGRLDVVVANAAISPPVQTLRVIDPAAFERTIEVNLIGVWRTVRAALPLVTEHEGHALLVASTFAFSNGLLIAPYAIAKAGVEQLARALRVELARHRTTVGVALLGATDTPFLRDALAEPAGSQLRQAFPSALSRPMSPQRAARVLVRAIERRSAQVVEPKLWRPLSVLRGVVNPLIDAGLMRAPGIQRAVATADTRPNQHPTGR